MRRLMKLITKRPVSIKFIENSNAQTCRVFHLQGTNTSVVFFNPYVCKYSCFVCTFSLSLLLVNIKQKLTRAAFCCLMPGLYA